VLYGVVFSAEELAFRDSVAAAVAAPSDRSVRQYFLGRGGASRALYRELGERGWLSLSWPLSFGGRDLPLSYEFLLWDTLAYRRACRPDIGPGLIARVLIEHGTRQQQDKYLPALAEGSLACSLGYSEPAAGSDLTHLRTRATRHGDSYVVHGHKIWTSEAHHATKLWLLCRTGDNDSGKRGLTILFVDLRDPQIHISPIPTMDGHQLNEVVLDGVVVPVEERVGAEGGAWEIIVRSLAVERHTQVLPGRLRRDLEELWRSLRDAGLADDGWVRHVMEELEGEFAAVEASSLATVSELVAGGDAVIPAARSKYLAAALSQKIARVGLDLLGTGGVIDDSELAFLWRQCVAEGIAGGTLEVMISMLARQGLQLGSTR